MEKLAELTIKKFHQMLKNRELTVRQLVDYYIGRMKEYDKEINSLIHINPNAQKEADEKDRQFAQRGIEGLLFGVPVLLKDNINTKDMPTTGGSLALEGVIPTYDAFVVSKLRKEGAILLAKVNLSEFACTGESRGSLVGQTNNPYDLTYTPGGSSGGTGAGLAADFGLAGLGTDTMNSVRSPASACSLAGIRSSRGIVSRSGVIPYALTHDSVGPLARTIEDAGLVLAAIAGYDEADPVTELSKGQDLNYVNELTGDLHGIRIGIVNSLIGKGEIHAEVNGLLQKAFEDLRELGAELVDFNYSIDMDELQREVNVQFHEQSKDMTAYLDTIKDVTEMSNFEAVLTSGKVDPWVASKMQKAVELANDTDEYQRRLANIAAFRDKVGELMDAQKLDALIYPEQQQLVAKVGSQQADRNGLFATASGFPAMVVPCGFSQPTSTAKLGIPVGIEFFGRPFSEKLLVKIAYAYEQMTKHRKPPILK